MATTQAPGTFFGLTTRAWMKKIAVMVLVGALLAWFYGWMSPRAYPADKMLGFGYGAVHGALMPMALPSLLLGQNPEIFAANNSGRGYKLGYIAGINVCGFVVFGATFWKPKK